MKKIALLLIFCCTLSTTYARVEFTDVNPDSDVYDAVMYLREHDIIGGYADGSFRENALINRAEFTKIVIIATSGGKSISCGPTTTIVNPLFHDVRPADWFYSYVCYGKQQGILRGYADGNFRPQQTITMSEAAKIIAKAFGTKEKFVEGELWYAVYIQYLTGKRSIPAHIERFDHPVTRGDMSEMVFRLLADVRYKEYVTYEEMQTQGKNEHMTCAAYYQGFVPSYAKNACILYGVSDCSSPFIFETEKACNEAFDF